MTVFGTPVSLVVVILVVIMMVVCMAGCMIGCLRSRRGGKSGCCSVTDNNGPPRDEAGRTS